jgi:hypothetical protein
MSNTPGSNASKNKKKRDKKKAKKQAAAGSNTQPGINTPSLTAEDSLNQMPLNNDTTIAQEPTTTESAPLSGVVPSLPPASIEDNKLALGNTTASEATPLSGDSSVMAASLPAPPIKEDNTRVDSDANKLAFSTATDSNPEASVTKDSTSFGRTPATDLAGVGAYGATAAVGSASAAAVSNNTDSTTAKSKASVPLPETFALSDNVQHCIESAVASRSIDVDSIVRTIAKNVEFGDYKARAKLPDELNAKNTAIAPSTDKSDTKNPIQKAAAGVGATIAGASAAVAGATSSSISREPVAATEQTKLSDNVQYCIKSVVQAPSAEINGIPGPSETVKRPEPAVGAPAQPVMPSSAKAPDVPKKEKPSERRHRPAFLNKKKDCIIL